MVLILDFDFIFLTLCITYQMEACGRMTADLPCKFIVRGLSTAKIQITGQNVIELFEHNNCYNKHKTKLLRPNKEPAKIPCNIEHFDWYPA